MSRMDWIGLIEDITLCSMEMERVGLEHGDISLLNYSTMITSW